jgi:hypothetical protein
MAVHMLNICVDMPDAAPDYVPEDLTVNDQESLVEMVLEKGLDIENAIEEHDEADDTNSQNFEMCKDIKFHSVRTELASFERPYNIVFLDTPYKMDYSFLYFKEINPPPPKA